MRSARGLAAVLVLLVGSAAAEAQRGQGAAPAVPAPAGTPNIFGNWMLLDPGSGNWTNWFDNVPAADVTPEVTRYVDWVKATAAAGNVVNNMSRRADCPQGNLPMTMAGSGVKTIAYAPQELRVVGRTIYTDKRPHPAPGTFAPSGLGHSVGRWEGDTLVVETVGFPGWLKICDSTGPTLRVPGGGIAIENTRLVERYRLTNPDTLQITFTWKDPQVYRKPHTYSYNLSRVKGPLQIDPPDAPPKRQFLTDKYSGSEQ